MEEEEVRQFVNERSSMSIHSRQSTVSIPMEKEDLFETTIRMSTIGMISIIVNSSFTILSLLRLFSDVTIYWSSFTVPFRQEVLIKNGYPEPLSIRQLIDLSRPSSPHFDLILKEHRRMNIEYGTTWHNWCWNEPVPDDGWPSILRSIEFHSLSQLLIRCTFLWSILIRPLFTHYRSMSILDRITQSIFPPPSPGSITSSSSLLPRIPANPPLLPSLILYSSSSLHFLLLFTGFLATTWQQNQDFLNLMWIPFYTHALFFLLHSLIYTAIELLDTKRVIWSRFVTRSLLIFIFSFTMFPVLHNISDFIENKTCHVMISRQDAVSEYICLLSMTLFSLLEWTDIWSLHFVSEDSMTWKGYPHSHSHL
ncbi:hypothetical protein PENTCL1PPCAC_17401 [Pristionchus entomophagus]|uniref:Transmembrane protein n=1 Tax=Pristionchus entomophagus TaxID=358040 RepID=A0AAV5TLJ4_9BILA|nr:hypothetical protein PENTCL1PPCAC_17401 [Pristionchus entomophagus]